MITAYFLIVLSASIPALFTAEIKITTLRSTKPNFETSTLNLYLRPAEAGKIEGKRSRNPNESINSFRNVEFQFSFYRSAARIISTLFQSSPAFECLSHSAGRVTLVHLFLSDGIHSGGFHRYRLASFRGGAQKTYKMPFYTLINFISVALISP